MSKSKPETEAISLTESQRLIKLEKIIKAGEQTFIEIGNALLEIRDSRLYRADFSTFDEYCEEKWGWGSRRGYQLIIAAETVKTLPKTCEPLVHTERAARELSKIPARKREAVLEKIVDAGKPVTTKTITAASIPSRKPAQKKPAPVIEVKHDEVGRAIPDAILPLWERGYEMEAVAQHLAAAKRALVKAEKEHDPLYAHFDFQTSLGGIEKALTECRVRKPYSVCPDCQGKDIEDCATCKRTGLIGEFTWKHQTAEEKKKMILKTVNKK